MLARAALLTCLLLPTAVLALPQTVVQADRTTGLVTQIKAGATTLLAAPARLVWAEAGQDLPALQLAPQGPNAFSATAEGLSLSLRQGHGVAPFVEFAVRNTGGKTRTIACGLQLPVKSELNRGFFPAAERAHVALGDGAVVRYGYAAGGTQLAMPLGQVYSEKQDCGLVCFGEFGLLVEPLLLEVGHTAAQTTLTASFVVRLEPNAEARRRLYLAATEGDWRPALAAALAEFPRALEPQNPALAALHGPFECSGGTPADDSIRNWYDQGCRVVEIHATFPFYGDYVPHRAVWTPLVDDTWHTLKTTLPPDKRPAEDASWQEIRDFVEKQVPPTMTQARVNDYLDRLHAQGLKGLIYFNPTEAWAPWAAEKFAADRNMAPNGKPYPAWYESSSMIPDKARPWGKYLLAQLRGQLDAYPQLDGVFFDQSAAGGHDLTELCAEGAKLVRARGGICWWNGPYNLELAALADGLMDEGGGTDTYRTGTEIIQYYGLAGKPIVSLGPANTKAYAEMLAHGILPQPVGKSNVELGRRWWPLFGWLHNRRWVLDAHALDAPDEVDANLLRVPSGNLVVTMVPEPLSTDDRTRACDVPLTVRVPEAASVKGAYALLPDQEGYHKLDFSRQGQTLRLTLPRLGPAAVVVLARTGVFPALAGPPVLVEGQETKLRWGVDNWTAAPVAVDVALNSGRETRPLKQNVAPGKRAEVEIPVKALPQAARATIALTGRVAGAVVPSQAEVAVEAPLLVDLQAPAQVRDDETFTATATVLSHASTGTSLSLAATCAAGKLEPAATTLKPVAGKPETLKLTGHPTGAGETWLQLTATLPGGQRAQAEARLEVLATALNPAGLAKVRAAQLECEVFGVDAGPYEHKPVAVNGVAIGNLAKGSGDSWSTVAMALTPAALAALREHNEISIDNQVADAFKVRNFRLLLHMRGGVTVVSGVDHGVYTGWTDWAFGEGKQFAAGQPLTGIAVDLKLDPTRQERYEELFGTPRSARLLLEVNGADGGQYAHKPVTVNGETLGDLPSAGDWTLLALPLPPAALDKLMTHNEVTIANSVPPDAFKVRRARLEIENTAGQTFTSETDAGAHTSCSWDLAEGTVGSPIRIHLSFRPPRAGG